MALAHRSVGAAIPTRGNVDLGPIVERILSYPEVAEVKVVVGTTPFNRYVAAMAMAYDVIYTQDDDCITDLGPILEAYEPGVIVNAMTPEHAALYRGRQTLIGFGCLFDRELAASVLSERWRRDELFYRESDRVFATVNRHKTVFPKIEILEYAYGPDRMYRQPEHHRSRVEMEQRLAATGYCL